MVRVLSPPAAKVVEAAHGLRARHGLGVAAGASLWATEVVRHASPVPGDLREHLRILSTLGVDDTSADADDFALACAASTLYGDAPVASASRPRDGEAAPPPAHRLAPFLGAGRALRFESLSVAAFFASVFVELAEAAGLRLCGWDLYHGHLVAFRDHGGAPDLGILFHAREHPREFTNRRGPLLPVCAPEVGGDADPRRGTTLSIEDEDYRHRNFLWLLSENATFRVEVSGEEQTTLLSAGGRRFFTVDEGLFGTQLGTVCLFPGSFTAVGAPAEDYDVAIPAAPGWRPKDDAEAWRCVLCVPCHGFPPDWRLASELAPEAPVSEAKAVALLRRIPGLDACAVELLGGGGAAPGAERRRQRFGASRAAFLSAARASLLERGAAEQRDLERRLAAATADLEARGIARADAEAALALTEGSAVRAEALLHVAYDRYRSAEERVAAGASAPDHGLPLAARALYGVSPWLGGEPALALTALREAASADDADVEAAVQAVAARQQAAFAADCSARLDAAISAGAAPAASAAAPAAGATSATPLAQAPEPSPMPAAAEPLPEADASRSPRCCRAHALEHHAMQSGEALSREELDELAALHRASEGDAWLVLVGGEHGGIMREDARHTRPGPYLAGHCSLQWVGITYARLVRYFGRRRTIVIAQLDETLSWLRRAARDEASAERFAGKASLLPMLRRRLAETEAACAQLIADGGADYDGPSVHAATVLRVLRGEAPASGLPVVPQQGAGAVVLVMVSHGNAHPAGTRHHEWYMHMPYAVPPQDDGIYDCVAHSGFQEVDPHPEWDWGAPKHRFKLYSQMLFSAHHAALERAPRRRFVILHQFCLSGGAVNFMRQRSYRAYFGTRRWPMFAIVTADCFEAALGNFVGLWTEELEAALRTGGGRTLGDVYRAAHRRYWDASPELRESNAIASRGHLSAAADAAGDGGQSDEEPTTVGTIGREAGFDACSGASMDDLPVRHIANFL